MEKKGFCIVSGDVELRDLVDEMILLTDASLGREDARFQSAQMFFAEENSKLKK